jgi:CDP-4-dehydro-6-deoxyglucose reductase
VFWGGRQSHDLYLDISVLTGNHKYIPVLSRAELWQGERGYIQDALLRHKTDLSNCSVYACGSDDMIRSAKDALAANGLPSGHFFFDAFLCSGNAAAQK